MAVCFSIIHPSRSRPLLAKKAYDMWTKNIGEGVTYEYILSLDISDPLLSEYFNLFSESLIVLAENKNVVEAMNGGAAVSVGDVLVCISDDFLCPENWGAHISENIDSEKMEALQISDGYSLFAKNILTLPILTRKLYKRLGYVYYPEYTGIYADNDLAELCAANGWLKKNDDKVFLHVHWANGLTKKDGTHERHDNPRGWRLGEAVIAKRRAADFGIEQEKILSILIPTILGREAQLNSLCDFIIKELKSSGYLSLVEVAYMRDNKELSIGNKRQLLYERSKGKYVWQIDDDDLIATGALKKIIPILQDEEPDCICFLEECRWPNGKIKIAMHSNRFSSWGEGKNGIDYERTPFYKNVLKRSIAIDVGVNDMRYGEDEDFAKRLKESGLIKKEFFINEPIYYYRCFDSRPIKIKFGIK